MKFVTVFLGVALSAGVSTAQDGNQGGCGVGQTTNGCGLSNGPLSNQSLSGGALGAGVSITGAGTFSTGFVSTPDGLNSANVQSFGLSEANAAAVGEGSVSGSLDGPLTGSVKGSGLTNSTSYSGSLVGGTGSAWNVTGGGAIAVGGGLGAGSVTNR